MVTVNDGYVAACKTGVRCDVYNRSDIHAAPQSVFQVGAGYGSQVVLLEGASLGISEDTANDLHFWHVDGTDTWTKVESIEFQGAATPTFIDAATNEHGNVTAFLDSSTRYLKTYEMVDGDATFLDADIIGTPKSVAIMGPNGECLIVGDSDEANARVFYRIGDAYFLRMGRGAPGIATGNILVAAGKEHFAIANADALSGAGRLNVFKYDFETELTTTSNALLDVFGENSTSAYGTLVSVSKIDDSVAVYEPQRKLVHVYWLDGSGNYFAKYTVEYANGIADLHIESKTVLFTVDAVSGQVTEHVRHDGTYHPTRSPTGQPTNAPSTSPTGAPSTSPTAAPSTSPTAAPSLSPTGSPTVNYDSVGDWTQDNPSHIRKTLPTAQDQFGLTVAIDGDKMVAGTGDGDHGTIDNGFFIAYTWDGSNWVTAGGVTRSTPYASSDYFGHAMSISGDKLAVGAWGDSAGGTAFTYQWSGTAWVQDVTYINPGSVIAGDYFGWALSMSGDKLVVSAYGVDGGIVNQGAVYTYLWSGTAWVQQDEIIRSGVANSKFGYDVAISGDEMIVGTNGERAVYFYNWNSTNWVQTGKYIETDAGITFGNTVAMDGDKAAATSTLNEGVVYTYHYSGGVWNEVPHYLNPLEAPPGVVTADNFGYRALDIDGNLMAVGAKDSSNGGKVFMYQWHGAGWVRDDNEIVTANIAAFDDFGTSVAISGERMVIGSRNEDQGTAGSGAISTFFFNLHVTNAPTLFPTKNPTTSPTFAPTNAPSTSPTSSPTAITNYTFNQQLSVPSGNARSPATNGQILAIGSSTYGGNIGAVHTYQWVGQSWVFLETLVETGLVSGDYYGGALSLVGDKLVVSAVGKDTVYCYTISGTTFTLSDVLTPLGSTYFGRSVSLSENDMLVISDDQADSNKGKVHTYQWDGFNWVEELTYLQPPSLEAGDRFGTSITIHNTSLVVGVGYDDVDGKANAGSAYAYTWNGTEWVGEQFISPAELEQSDSFGELFIDIHDDRMAIAAARADNDQGKVFTYTWDGVDTWVQDGVPVLSPPELSDDDFFGSAGMIFENTLVVSAYGANEGGSNRGVVYTYTWSGHFWNRDLDVFSSPTPVDEQYFGLGITKHDEKIVIIDNSFVGGVYTWLGPTDTAYPTVSPTLSPTLSPTVSPTLGPTVSPSVSPTNSPTKSPIPYVLSNHTVKQTITGTDSFGSEVSGNGNGVIAVTYDHGVKLYHVESSTDENSVITELHDFYYAGAGINTPTFIGDGNKMVLGANSGDMDVYSSGDGGTTWAKTNTLVDTHPGFARSITACTDGTKFLVQSYGSFNDDIPSRVYTYDTATMTKISTATINSESLSLSAGASMACGTDHMIVQFKSFTKDRVRLFKWNALTSKWDLVRSLVQPNEYSDYGDTVMIMQNDGLIALASPSSGVIDIFKVKDVAPFYSITGGQDAHTSVTHDDEWLITNNNHTTLIRYDLTDGAATQVYTLGEFSSHTMSLYISGLDTFVGSDNTLSVIHDDVEPNTRAPTLAPPTAAPTPGSLTGSRGELCANDGDCTGTLVCNNYCVLPPTSCTEHSDCFSTRVEGYLPECNFESEQCINVKLSTCQTQISCASEAKTYESVVNTQTIDITNLTNSSEVFQVVQGTSASIKANTNVSSIRISSSASYAVNVTITNVTTSELEIASKRVACGDVNDQCGTEVSARRRLSDSEEVITIILSFDLDEDAYNTLVETGVSPDDPQFVELLALELGVESSLIQLNEYLPDFFAVEVLVTERFSQLYDTAIATISTISDVIDDVITNSEFGESAFNKQVTEQCPPTKTCSYRGTCNSTTGVCDCDEGFTGLLCNTAEGASPTVIHVDEFHIRISDAHTAGTAQVGGTATAEKRTAYYYYEDFVSVDNTDCPQPSFDGDGGDDWALVFARTISQAGGGSCVLQNFNQSKHTYICCFVRNLGMMPMYQYALDDDVDTSTGDSESGVWYAVDRDGNSRQNTDTRAPTSAPTSAPTGSPTTADPTTAPTTSPTNNAPTGSPTSSPTSAPTDSPTTGAPTTGTPTTSPTTGTPTTATPTGSPTESGSATPQPTHDTRSSTGDNTAGVTVLIISVLIPFAIVVVYLVGNSIIHTSRRMGGHRPLPQHRPFDF